MAPVNTPVRQSKHAWHLLSRINPSKRNALDRIKDHREIYAYYDERAVREQASRCVQCANPLCRFGCPLSNRIPQWLALTAEGQFLEAAEISRSTSNMPEICSRVCPQERLCEAGCVLNGRAEPVSIGPIEKFINEYAIAHGCLERNDNPSNGFRVAVIGAGPAGLACSDELSKLGYAVTVFEAQNVAGGLLVNGIPAFKLEKSVVSRRIEAIASSGVDFRLSSRIGRDLSLTELMTAYDSVFIALGAQAPKPFGIPGSDLIGVFDALPFLASRNGVPGPDTPTVPVAGKRVVVLGGGDTAMDCLRTAIRGGAADAICLYRRDLANMPGNRREYENAIEEGAKVQFLTNPVKIHGDELGRVTHVTCIEMALGEPDAGGRRKPRPVPGSEFQIAADIVLAAYGFDPEPLSEISGFYGLRTNEWGTVETDAHGMTSLPGVFAGGDIVRGPSLVVHAVRDGRVAASGIHHYLTGL